MNSKGNSEKEIVYSEKKIIFSPIKMLSAIGETNSFNFAY